MKIPPSQHRFLEEFYVGIPVLNDHDSIFSMIDTFCEHIWHKPSFEIVETHRVHDFPESPINDIDRGDNESSIIPDINVMEARYAFENEMIRAVSLGQRHKENLFSSALSNKMFEVRAQDPIRNAKNYSIIMNTLLRKAAETGGVHPVYIDKASSKFALKIEQISTLNDVYELMREMFHSYCRLVYKHSIKKYSPIVQKTILIIDSDLSAELTLRQLAHQQGISEGYLATVFKKETEKTLTEYVREKRINHAKYLLRTTNLQIQTVAAHCGIMDVQYFTKTFKSVVGKTPRQYREEATQGS